MNLLDLYLKTEAMRLEKEFSYSFELKKDLDPDEFILPTMILQPFVENSIWHGISHLKEKTDPLHELYRLTFLPLQQNCSHLPASKTGKEDLSISCEVPSLETELLSAVLAC